MSAVLKEMEAILKNNITYEGSGKKIAYISGAITGNPAYLDQFRYAEEHLKALGYVVLNPTTLPVGMPHERYLPINDAMIGVCDEMFLIPWWENSSGVAHEIETAKSLGRPLHELPKNLFELEAV